MKSTGNRQRQKGFSEASSEDEINGKVDAATQHQQRAPAGYGRMYLVLPVVVNDRVYAIADQYLLNSLLFVVVFCCCCCCCCSGGARVHACVCDTWKSVAQGGNRKEDV